MRIPLVRILFSVLLLSSMISLVACQQQAPPPPPVDEWSRPAPPPVSNGRTHLVFSGVSANFPRIAVWLLNGMYRMYPRGSFRGDVIFIGTSGAVRALTHVGDGLAHFTITTPAPAATMAFKGIGVYTKAYPNLRGVFRLPQRDPITLAVRADLGIATFDEVIQKKIPLKMATGHQDSERAIGFLFAEFMKAYGSSVADLESWGGAIVPEDNAGPAMTRIENGEANAIFHEAAVMASPQWRELNRKIPMRILSIPDSVIEKLGVYGFRKFEYTIPRGKYPGVVEPVNTIDYSDWIVIASASVPDEIVYNMAKVAVEQKDAFESQYRDMLPAGSQEMGQYVADPKWMARDLGVPLHPGAEKYFREKGLLP